MTGKTINTNEFWRDKLTWRSTATGMNENVIGTYAPYNKKKDIIAHMKQNIVSYSDGRKYSDNNSKNDYFTDIVNDCMKKVYLGLRGYVFTDSQLKEVMMIKPDINITYSDRDVRYYCWK